MQSHVFKHKRRIDGKVIASRCWYGRYKLHGDLHVTTIPLETTDKDVARERLTVHSALRLIRKTG